MGQKIHPILYRIGVNKETDSIWFAQGPAYVDSLQEDIKVRKYIHKRLGDKMVSKVKIFRKTSDLHRHPSGLVIGRKAKTSISFQQLNILINKNSITVP